MIKNKKIILSLMSVLAVICVAFALYSGVIRTASADYQTVSTENYLDIDGHTLNGFKSGVDLPDKINLVIPDGITEISSNAFAGNTAIVRVVLNAELENIGMDAFANCQIAEVYDKTTMRLTELNGTTLDLGYTGLGRLVYSALNVCYDEAHSYFTVDADGYMFCKDTRSGTIPVNYLVGYVGDGGELELPEYYPQTTESYNIYQYSFWSLGGITGVIIPEGVEIIGNYAFYSCSHLKSVILPSSSLSEIGASAFQGCEKLTKVAYSQNADSPDNIIDLPEGLRTIGSSAFSGLINAYHINVPSSVSMIDVYAFENCTSGASAVNEETSIYFAEGEEELTISRYAFYNCSGLKVVNFPQRLNVLFARAFAGCTSLAFAYLPDGVNYTTVSANETLYFEQVTAIIYDSFASYNAAVNAEYIKNHADRITYTVDVEFYETDELGITKSVTTEKRLYGNSYQYVQSADLSWATLDSAVFPVQSDYGSSVWYLSSDFDNKATVNNVSALLRNLKAYETDVIKLYAHLIYKPELSAAEGLIYDENTVYSQANIKAFINTSLSQDAFTATYALNIDGVSGGTMKDAGSYRITVEIKDTTAYGSWAEDVALTVVIGKKTVDISELRWNMDAYDMGIVYLYENANGGIYPSYTELKSSEIPSGYSYAGAKTVLNSIVRYRRKQFEITLNAAEHDGKFSIEYNSTNVGTDIGEYQTVATLVASANYQLVSERAVSPSYGVVINITEDACTVTKTWYIVDIKNGLYTDSGLSTEYSIADWVYGTDVQNFAPVPQWGTNSISLTFTLFKNGMKIGDNFDSANFGYYINSSMPADVYDLSVFVPSYQDYIAYTQSYTFTVENRKIDGELLNKLNDGIKGKTFVFEYDGLVKTYDKTSVALDFTGAFKNEKRTGIWATFAFNGYYSSQFEMSYNLARMFSNSYYTEDELENTRYKPIAPGTYTLYYQLSANNYAPLADVSDDEARRVYAFEVIIYGLQEAPVIEDIAYTGESVRPQIPSQPLYVVESVDDACVEVGIYYITLTLNDPEHYVWEDNDYESGSDGKIRIPFNIVRADNEPTLALNLIRWTWGSYSPDTNIPVWDTRFKDGSADFITYKLVSVTDGKTYFYANGGFAEAPAGNYIFSAYAKGYVEGDISTYKYNWNSLSSSEISVTVAKATNRWTQTPNIVRWQWKDFDEQVHKITATPLYSEEDAAVKFSVLFGDGKTINSTLLDFELENGLIPEKQAAVIKTLNAGQYRLVAKVEPTANYTGLDTSATGDTPLQFEILQATNRWESTPNIIQWNWGNYNKTVNRITAVPTFGSVTYRMYSRSGDDYNVVTFENGSQKVESFIVGADGIVEDYIAQKLSSLDADTYYLLATVVSSSVSEGNGNYSGLNNDQNDFTPIAFTVQRVNNYWKQAPNILSWTSGNYDKAENAITATPAYGGKVVFTVTDADGKSYDVNKLSYLKEGSYTLTAVTEATDNYSGLNTQVQFRVFGETSTSFKELQIGALSVMSVTIAALAVAAVVMLIPKKGGKK